MMDGDPLEVVRTVDRLGARLDAWRQQGHTIGLVPTMGGLHDGHLALITASVATTARTVASLFVNPTQFGPDDDFQAYPRDEDKDLGLFAAAGAHLVFAPTVDEMYPGGLAAQASVAAAFFPDLGLPDLDLPDLGDVLEGECRPGFFTGVATVVAKLFTLTLPDKAFFGEKDYQQLQVVRRLAAGMDLPGDAAIDVIGIPTVREGDGLALSSRNVYLTESERRAAPALFRVLSAVAQGVAAGAEPAGECEKGTEVLLAAGFSAVDYLTVRDAETLGEFPAEFPAPIEKSDRPGRVLAAARLGRTRLIDNVAV